MNQRIVMEWPTSGGARKLVVDLNEQVVAIVEGLVAESVEPCIILVWFEGTTRELGFGLGREHTVFTFQESSDPPYFISLGGKNVGPEVGSSCFRFGDEENEYESMNLVDSALILPVLRSFLLGDAPPKGVDWERL